MRIKADITPIIKVGAVGNPRIGDGRLLPYITVDCTNNRGLEQLIELHGETPIPGDVISAWGWQRFDRSNVFLTLKFSRPMKTEAHLRFSVKDQGYVVDWILEVKGLYLQSSKYGDRASVGYGEPSVLVEVPHSATFPIWNNLHQKFLKKKFKKMGFAKTEVSEAIKDYKRLQREMWFRRSSVSDTRP